MSCNCPSSTACEQLEPIIVGDGIAVLDSNNCLKQLVTIGGAMLYTDGNQVYFADGSSARPLILPGLTYTTPGEATPLGRLLFQSTGGTIVGTEPLLGSTTTYLSAVGGEWVLSEIPPQTSFPVDDIPSECCCPAAFAVLSLSEDEETYELRRFNPCEDATTVNEGPILTCEDGCMRRLAGTSNDQVPVWDNAEQIWVPTEISDLVPVPESDLDVAYFYVTQSGDQTTLPTYARAFSFYPHGAGGPWTLVQSGSIINSAVVATPYISHSAIRVINAGWHRVDFTVTGSIALVASTITLEGTTVSSFVEAQHTGAAQPFEFYGGGGIAFSGADPNFVNRVLFNITGSYAKNFAANEDVDIVHNLTFSEAGGGSVAFTATNYSFTFRCQGTVTRIT